MDLPLETLLAGAAALLLLSVVLSKASDRLGIPSLLIFLVLGMLAGSEGPGGVHFDDPNLAQGLGVAALCFILFAGGLETDWEETRPVLWPALSLSTLGVLVSAVLVGWFASALLGVSRLEGLLLGAIVASTDAAAVFTVLRARNVNLKGGLKPLLEMESGSNDPMAVFLTTGLIGLLSFPDRGAAALVPAFLLQMSVGLAAGYGLGKAFAWLINRLRLEHEGLYPVLTMALVLLTYGGTTLLGGNGFLAVYVAGLAMGNSDFLHKRSLGRFHDGLAWIMQIAMFLALGLLVFPARLAPVAGAGLLIAFFLIFAARPAAVFLCLAGSGLGWRKKAMVSWVGLRGAVPIVLATFPRLAGLPEADLIFHLVFFIVLTSALVQGVSIPWVARLLEVDAPRARRRPGPIEMDRMEGVDMRLTDLIVPYEGGAAGKTIVELGLPPESLIVLACRGEKFLVPAGQTVLEGGDVLWVLVDDRTLPEVRDILTGKRPGKEEGPGPGPSGIP
jgi:potassium/hydrogen antiporter